MASKVIFLNRFFRPDYSAASQLLSDLVDAVAKQGNDVCVITSRQLYDNPAVQLNPREHVGRVTVLRVATARFVRHSLLGRMITMLSFYVMGGWLLLRVARRGDIVVVMTDPPLMSVVAAWILRWRGAMLINWLQDIYPEVARELGVRGLHGVFGGWLTHLRNRSLRRAAVNVVIGDDMERRVRGFGVPKSAIATVANWTDDSAIRPGGGDALRISWGLADKFVIGYSGNLGRGHDIETFLGAAERLKNRRDIVFLFIGGGHARGALRRQLEAREISNVQFQPYQPRAMLAQSLAVAHVHWLSMRSGLEGLILPCKFYGVAAAGRPLIVVSSPGMEFATLVRHHNCGVAVPIGDCAGFAQAVEDLASDAGRCAELGQNARRLLDDQFTKARALERWSAILGAVARSSQKGSAAPSASNEAVV